MRSPPALRPGDRVAVVAPSSPFDRTAVFRGMAFLATRYRLRFSGSFVARRGFLAGDDARRRDELAAALVAPGVRAVLVARGGYGLGRIAHELPWDAFQRAPRWIVGFSDATALHVECARLGVASLHADNVSGLGPGDARARERYLDALEAPGTARGHGGLEVWRPGRAEGVLAGGNLTLLHACAAAGRLALPAGCLLAVEDVTEAPYRLDRMWTALLVGGHLRGVAGIVVGDFTDCPPGRHGVPVAEVLRERLGALGVPVAAGAPFGHGEQNHPLHLGARAVLDATGARAHLSWRLAPSE